MGPLGHALGQQRTHERRPCPQHCLGRVHKEHLVLQLRCAASPRRDIGRATPLSRWSALQAPVAEATVRAFASLIASPPQQNRGRKTPTRQSRLAPCKRPARQRMPGLA
eukprot:scaffold98838_cov69-Phaeocystis_antarctica.AAC.6